MDRCVEAEMHKRELRRLLYAMLLGDGNLGPNNYGTVSFRCGHSTKQEDFALWKVELIDRIFREKGLPRRCKVYYKKDRRFDPPLCSVHYHLNWHKYLRFLYRWVYKNGKTIDGVYRYGIKRIEPLLKEIDSDLHVAIWFGDDGYEEHHRNRHVDGSVYLTNPRLMLATNGFTEGEVRVAKEWFQKTYGLDPRIVFSSRKTGRRPILRFVAKDSRLLFERIGPLLSHLDSMQGKFSLAYERYAPEHRKAERVSSDGRDQDIVQSG